jgi:hypothetical protein
VDEGGEEAQVLRESFDELAAASFYRHHAAMK